MSFCIYPWSTASGIVSTMLVDIVTVQCKNSFKCSMQTSLSMSGAFIKNVVIWGLVECWITRKGSPRCSGGTESLFNPAIVTESPGVVANIKYHCFLQKDSSKTLFPIEFG